MKNTHKGFVNIWLIVGIVIGAVAIATVSYTVGQRHPRMNLVPEENTVQEKIPEAVQESTVLAEQESMIEADPNKPGWNILTSPSLGIRYSYPVKMDVVVGSSYRGTQKTVSLFFTPRIEDNKLYLSATTQGYINSPSPSYHVAFFKKENTESFSAAVFNRFITNKINCSVRGSASTNGLHKYVIVDWLEARGELVGL